MKPESRATSSLLVLRGFRDRTQEVLFQKHKVHFPNTLAPLVYHPNNSRKQNIRVRIPGTDKRVVLGDVVDVANEAAAEGIKTDDWYIGNALTIHKASPTAILGNSGSLPCLEWSLCMHHLERVTYPLVKVRIQTVQQLRNVTAEKLTVYKQHDQSKQWSNYRKVSKGPYN